MQSAASPTDSTGCSMQSAEGRRWRSPPTARNNVVLTLAAGVHVATMQVCYTDPEALVQHIQPGTGARGGSIFIKGKQTRGKDSSSLKAIEYESSQLMGWATVSTYS